MLMKIRIPNLVLTLTLFNRCHYERNTLRANFKSSVQAVGSSFGGAVCVGAVLLIAASAPSQTRFVDDHRGGDFRRVPPFDGGLGQNLFVSDAGSGNIYEFTPGGVQSTFASGLNQPLGLAF